MPGPIIERVDEIPLLIYWLLKMQVDVIIDRVLPQPHGNRQGLSYGQLALLFVVYVIYLRKDRLCGMEKWVAHHRGLLQQITGWTIHEKDATDDRLGDLLSELGEDESRGEELQRGLGQHLIQAYRLPTERVRYDTTSFSVHHAPMKTIIYYFTGTGNTLAIARGIAEELGDTKPIPLRRAMHPGGVAPAADAVGIAFPVYFLNMPALVRQFVQNIRFDGNPYIFGIATCGERPGGALFNVKRLLEEKGTTLSAGFVFVMPENYIGPIDLMGDAPRRKEKYTVAKSRIPAVAAAIRDRKLNLPEGSDSVILKIGGRISNALATSVYNTPGRFHATAACNHCGICGRICPTRNITVTEHGVDWGRECTQCYACIHWCPTGAIEIGGRTKGRQRYNHPDITLRDMLDQRGEI